MVVVSGGDEKAFENEENGEDWFDGQSLSKHHINNK